MKAKKHDSRKNRWIVGFVAAFLSLVSFVTMLGFVGAMEWDTVSIFFGTVGAITGLIVGVALFYFSSLCLYDHEF